MAKEKVIEGTVTAEQAISYGFETIKAEDVVVTIDISSGVRQVGQTSIAVIIQNALKAAGYDNVELVSKDMENYQRLEKNSNYPAFKLFETNHPVRIPGRKLKLRVIDQPQNIRFHNKAV